MSKLATLEDKLFSSRAVSVLTLRCDQNDDPDVNGLEGKKGGLRTEVFFSYTPKQPTIHRAKKCNFARERL